MHAAAAVRLASRPPATAPLMPAEFLLPALFFVVAVLYSSVGHAGASGGAVLEDDAALGRLLAAQSQLPVWAYGKAADCRGFNRYLAYDDVLATEDGYQLQLSSHVAEYNFYLPLLGEFNIQNVLAAMSSMLVLGYDLTTVVAACSQLKPVPGRMEQFKFAQNFTAVVDYAHTPDALENVLDTINNIRSQNEQLISILGCGGNRDKEKRPEMGRIAAQKSNKVILTSDNPRTEDPQQIIEEMMLGIHASDYKKILKKELKT